MDSAASSIIKVIDTMMHQENFYGTKRGLYDEETGEKRRQLATWFIEIMKFLHFQHNTIAVALNIFDRFLAARTQLLLSNYQFQLAAIACLYISVKINEQVVLMPSQLSDISKGLFSSTEIEQMEFQILTSLDWRVNPPTALSFVKEYLKLFIATGSINTNEWDAINKLASEQIFHAIQDSEFVGFSASGLALTAICNATTELSNPIVQIPSVLQVDLLPLRLQKQLFGCALLNSKIPKHVISPKKYQQAGRPSSRRPCMTECQ